MRRAQILTLIWFSDACFQLAGGFGLVAIVLTSMAQGRPALRGFVFGLYNVAAALAAGALLTALTARALHTRRDAQEAN